MTAPEYDGPTCAAAGCTRLPDPVICRKHADELGQTLANIGVEYDQLSAEPSMQGREPNSGGRAGLASQKTVGRLDVMALRDGRPRERGEGDEEQRGKGVLEVLRKYAGRVWEGRGLTAPIVAHTLPLGDRPAGPLCDTWCEHQTCDAWTLRWWVTPSVTVTWARSVLATHLDWAIQQPWAGQLHDEVRHVYGRLRAANGHVNPVRDPVLTTAQTADYLGVTPRAVRLAVDRGRLTAAARDNEGWLFRASDVVTYDATRRNGDVAERENGLVPSLADGEAVSTARHGALVTR